MGEEVLEVREEAQLAVAGELARGRCDDCEDEDRRGCDAMHFEEMLAAVQELKCRCSVLRLLL